MNVVMPMAGRGARFAEHGITTPKPLISAGGRPILEWALRSLVDILYSRCIVIALAQQEAEYGVCELVRRLVGPRSETILLDSVTEGQLCTVLAARAALDTDEPVLIISADTYVVSNLGSCLAQTSPECRGIISVADMPGDRWSFARTDETGRVVEVAEKVRISDHASTGLYYFASAREFLEMADEMIRRSEKTRGEYYVMPVYEKYISRGCRIDICTAQAMWDMGTPDALARFEEYLREAAGQSPEKGEPTREPNASDRARALNRPGE